MEIDAKNKILGRLASEVAKILQVKNQAEKIIIKNISQIKISGKKYTDKKYYKPVAGYVGHLKIKTFKQIFEKNSSKVFEKAVFNMLPKNRLRKPRMGRLEYRI